MPKPKYMRYVAEDYLADTEPLDLAEQGAYWRLVSKMWLAGGRIRADDSLIARMLGVHTNRWMKLKPAVVAYFIEKEGFYTQKRLKKEYTFSVSQMAVDNSDNEGNTPSDTRGVTPTQTPPVTKGVTLPVTPPDTKGVTPPVTQGVLDDKTLKNSDSNSPPTVLKEDNPSRARTLSQSNSISKDKRSEMASAETWKKLSFECDFSPEEATEFSNELVDAFTELKLQPPQDFGVIHGWMQRGAHPFRDILPTVRSMLKRNVEGHHEPPKSWKYFANELFKKIKGGGNG